MTMAEYLRQARDEQWTAEFRERHGIPAQRRDDYPSAAEQYEASQHHAEYAPASH